jgi:hypothetical protein
VIARDPVIGRAKLAEQCWWKGDTLPAGNHHKKVEPLKNRTRWRHMIRKLKSGEYRLYSRKKNPKTGKRRNLGTFSSMEKAKAHERAVQYFKRH